MGNSNYYLGISLLVFLFLSVATAKHGHCRRSCKPPRCSCPTFRYPMRVTEIPQMVYFGFDDAVTPLVSGWYDQIFTEDRRNPNNCSIKMTLYVSNEFTDYSLVRGFYERGMEIGVHSVTHTSTRTADQLAHEANEQRRNLQNFADIPFSDIVGWRSPFLTTAGYAQPIVLKDLQFEYDISLTYVASRSNLLNPWPFTMDKGWPYTCFLPPCPTQARVPGFWEVPVNALLDYKGNYFCGYVDGCMNKPRTVDEAFSFLWNNFMTSYNGTRVPFGLNMHAAWFSEKPLLEATLKFLDELARLDDVYVVTVKQMLDWMKNPTRLSSIETLEAWGC